MEEIGEVIGQQDGMTVRRTEIPGLLVLDLPVHGDERGWFKENWHRAKMSAAGLPDFAPCQQSISFNTSVGTTRGIHAEPWDKLISVGSGEFFGAWVDLRAGATFGQVFTCRVGPSRAVFAPRGVGNAFQTLVDGTVYCYLVNDHWRPDAAYSMLNLADPTVAINWPIPLDGAVVSPKDRTHPALGQVVPVPGRKTLVIGANGQLGQALQGLMSADDDVEWVDVDTFDIADPDLESARRWPEYQTIINAAAYTAVDAAETPEGRLTAWKVNAVGPAALARIAAHHHLTLVHVSTDYVFDGTSPHPYREDDLPCPLGVYGQTKAAADLAICAVPRHYLIRTSWVVGSGPNFMRTMATLATRGISPKVVDDQIGRVTFADDLACAIVHLLESQAPFGTYNVTGGGETMSWAGVACQVYASLGVDPALVKPCSTKEYQAGKPGPIAPRPANSTLDLSKIRAAGFVPPPLSERLEGYLASLAGG